MADRREYLSHLLVEDRATDQEFRRRGGGNASTRLVGNRAAHGQDRVGELQNAFSSGDQGREQLAEEELRALGTVVTLEGDDPAYPLKLDSLQQLTTHRDPLRKRPKWLLLSVLPANLQAGTPERATVWVSDEYRSKFLQLFEDYLAKESQSGMPRNNALVANIARIRSTILSDLWQSEGAPPTSVRTW